MEYLVLTGFIMIILMTLLIATYTKISSVEKEIDVDAVGRAVDRLKEAADFVYAHGHPTKLTVSVYLPGDIDSENTFIENKTINIAVDVRGEHTDVWRSTAGNVGWDLYSSSEFPTGEGYYVFLVESTPFDSIYNGTINIHT